MRDLSIKRDKRLIKQLQYVNLVWIHIQINPMVKKKYMFYTMRSPNTIWIFNDIGDINFSWVQE